MSVDEQRDWLAHFARTEITKIFEKAKFNFQVYKMAVKSLQRKQKRKEEYEAKKKFKPPVKTKNQFTELGFQYQLGIVALMMIIFYLLDSQFGYFGLALQSVYK